VPKIVLMGFLIKPNMSSGRLLVCAPALCGPAANAARLKANIVARRMTFLRVFAVTLVMVLP
jgi:hypothetical protein